LIKNFFELCDHRASALSTSSQKICNNYNF